MRKKSLRSKSQRIKNGSKIQRRKLAQTKRKSSVSKNTRQVKHNQKAGEGEVYEKFLTPNEMEITQKILAADKDEPAITPKGEISNEGNGQYKLASLPFGKSFYNELEPEKSNKIFEEIFPKLKTLLQKISKEKILLCDISPANTLVDEEKDVRLIDFEFAHHNTQFNEKMIFSIMLATSILVLTKGDDIYKGINNVINETPECDFNDIYTNTMEIVNHNLEEIKPENTTTKQDMSPEREKDVSGIARALFGGGGKVFFDTYIEYVDLYKPISEDDFKNFVKKMYCFEGEITVPMKADSAGGGQCKCAESMDWVKNYNPFVVQGIDGCVDKRIWNQEGAKTRRKNSKKQKGRGGDYPVDLVGKIAPEKQWSGPNTEAPAPMYNGGLYTGAPAKGPWAPIPVTPTSTNMIMKNLKSANPPPGAMSQYVGTNRLGNNYTAMPGVNWYSNKGSVNKGPFAIKCVGGKRNKNRKSKNKSKKKNKKSYNKKGGYVEIECPNCTQDQIEQNKALQSQNLQQQEDDKMFKGEKPESLPKVNGSSGCA